MITLDNDFFLICMAIIAGSMLIIAMVAVGIFIILRIEHNEMYDDIVPLTSNDKNFCDKCYCPKCLKERGADSDELEP